MQPDFSVLKQPIEACTKCGLSKTCRSPYMLGRGKWDKPKIMFVTESPKSQDDNADMAFIGPAALVIDQMLKQLGIDVNDVYFSQVVRCAPPNDKVTDRQVGYCQPYITKEIELVQPQVIVTLGNGALKSLTGEGNITVNRGSVKNYKGIKIVPTFSPSKYLHGNDKRDYDFILEDIKKAFELANGAEIQSKVPVSYKIVRCKDDLVSMYQECIAAPILAADIETAGLSPHTSKSKVVCIQFSSKPFTGWLVPLQHAECFDYNMCLQCVQAILTSHQGLIGHHLKFDWKYIEHVLGFRPNTPLADTQVMHHLLYEEESKLGMGKLKACAQRYTDLGNYSPDDSDEFFASLPLMPLEKMLSYACSDTDAVFRIYIKLMPLIEVEGKLAIALKYEMAKLMLCADMERRGSCINWEYHAYLMEEFPKRLYLELDAVRSFPEVLEVEDELVEKAIAKTIDNKHKTIKTAITPERIAEWSKGAREKAYAETMFNPNSDDQMRMLLVDKLGLTAVKFTESGNISCDKVARAVWMSNTSQRSSKHKIIKALSSCVVASSTLSTVKQYVECRQEDNKIHSNYNTCIADTFRLSSSAPNLQNLPRDNEKVEEGEVKYAVGKGDIKRLFIAPAPGWKVHEPDGKQIEIVIAAVLSQDPEMLHALNEGLDMHNMLACRVYKKASADIDPVERYNGKQTNFKAVYGISPQALSMQLLISLDSAEDLLREYWALFVGLKRWIDSAKSFARMHGYIDSPIGHRRHLPAAQSSDEEARGYALRQAANYPIQSSASNLIIYALAIANNIYRKLGLKSYIFGQVHDSGWIATPDEEEELALGIALYCISNMPFDFINGKDERYPCPVKVQAEVKSGLNLCDTVKNNVKPSPYVASICQPHLDSFYYGKLL